MAEQDFDFEEWIAEHKLTDIKQCFIEHDMTCVDTLNMNNAQFIKLMGDKTILSNAHLIQIIVSSIQSLRKLRNEKTKKDKRLIFATQKENNTFICIEKYINNLDKLQIELETQIDTNIKNRQQQNNKDIEKYATSNSQTLAQMNEKINQTMSTLHGILTRQEQQLESKINEYRNGIKQVETSHTKNAENMHNMLLLWVSMIGKDITYFQDSINKCHDIVQKHEESQENENNANDNSAYTFKRSNTANRENEILIIGKNATTYYNKNLTIFNENKHTITQYNENELILNMKQIYSLHINENIYSTLCRNISEKLITLSNNNDNINYDIEDEKEQSQIIHISHSNESNNEQKTPAAYTQNFDIKPVPIPRIGAKHNPNPNQEMKEPAKISSEKVVINGKNSQDSVDISPIAKHPTDDSLDETTSNPHVLFQKIENSKSKSHSPPIAFESYWICGVCTFAENPGTFLICKICSSSRQLSQKKKRFMLSRQHSLSDPPMSAPTSPLTIPQSKSEFRARSETDAKADMGIFDLSNDKNGKNGKNNYKFKKSQSELQTDQAKKKKKRSLFGYNRNKNKKKSPKLKSKNKKKVQQ